MKKINGIIQPKLPFVLRKQGDIYAHYGPILSHFKTDNDDNYFMFWVDNDEKYNRWLLFEVTPKILKSFFLKKITLKEILTVQSFAPVYVVDLTSTVSFKNNYITQIRLLPNEYFPGEKSYFNEKIAQPYALKLAEIYKQIKFKPVVKNFNLISYTTEPYSSSIIQHQPEYFNQRKLEIRKTAKAFMKLIQPYKESANNLSKYYEEWCIPLLVLKEKTHNPIITSVIDDLNLIITIKGLVTDEILKEKINHVSKVLDIETRGRSLDNLKEIITNRSEVIVNAHEEFEPYKQFYKTFHSNYPTKKRITETVLKENKKTPK